MSVKNEPVTSPVQGSSSASASTSTSRQHHLSLHTQERTQAQINNPTGEPVAINRLGGRPSVAAACGPCKKAHLACDVARPCNRCVKLGKADICEDVPHKKRGRPKASKSKTSAHPAAGGTHASPGSSGIGKWRGGVHPPNDLSYLSQQPMEFGFPGHGFQRPIQTDLFELFTTADFKILRATPTCYPLTGFHPHEFTNISLFDYIHVDDREMMEKERGRLITVPYQPGGLVHTDRDTQAAVTVFGERELLSPAAGMREPYPNENVRILRSNHSFEWFNVRLHLGGALGGSLLRPDTFGRFYLVVSLLLLGPPETNSEESSQRNLSFNPSTPLTPGTVASSSSHISRSQFGSSSNLPGFSTIAAGTAPTVYDGRPPAQVGSPVVQQSPHGSFSQVSSHGGSSQQSPHSQYPQQSPMSFAMHQSPTTSIPGATAASWYGSPNPTTPQVFPTAQAPENNAFSHAPLYSPSHPPPNPHPLSHAHSYSHAQAHPDTHSPGAVYAPPPLRPVSSPLPRRIEPSHVEIGTNNGTAPISPHERLADPSFLPDFFAGNNQPDLSRQHGTAESEWRRLSMPGMTDASVQPPPTNLHSTQQHLPQPLTQIQPLSPNTRMRRTVAEAFPVSAGLVPSGSGGPSTPGAVAPSGGWSGVDQRMDEGTNGSGR